jgi:hypothetical protein
MGSRRIAAHPLIVAVALGLLSPAALSSLPSEATADEDGRRRDARGRADLRAERDALADVDAVAHLPAVSPDAFARSEQAWLAVTGPRLDVGSTQS